MTLVEVIGGLTLLATLLVAVLLARGRYMRQAAAADRRLQAVAAADLLLTRLRQDPASLPRSGAGQISADDQLSWRTQIIPNPEVNDMGAQVLQLQILDDRPVAAANPIVTTIELVIAPESKATPATNPSSAASKQSTKRPKTSKLRSADNLSTPAPPRKRKAK